MLRSFKRILVLAPHTDDGEFGCGGAMAKFVGENKEVIYAAFSSAEASVPEGFSKDILKHEVSKAILTLGIPKENLILFDYPVRQFQSHRQAILDDMIAMERRYSPDVIFLPSQKDTHQDHQTIAFEGFRAFKKRTMIGYEIPWNNLSFNTNAFIFLDECHIEKKVEAIECYESQKNRAYASREFLWSLARTRGTQIGCRFAEAFEVIRWIVK